MVNPAVDSGNCVVLFVKAPTPGRVKTRLCPPLSHEQAAQVYQSFAKDTVEQLQRGPFRCLVTYDPNMEYPTPAWTGFDLPWFSQIGVDLGERLKHAFQSAFDRGFSRVLAVGTDSPGFSMGQISEAFEKLASSDVVMGPALDGGYYLIGLNKPIPAIFDRVNWSSPEVAQQTRERVKQQKLSLAELASFHDVDTYVDLKSLHEQFSDKTISSVWHRTSSVLNRLFEGKDG